MIPPKAVRCPKCGFVNPDTRIPNVLEVAWAKNASAILAKLDRTRPHLEQDVTDDWGDQHEED